MKKDTDKLAKFIENKAEELKNVNQRSEEESKENKPTSPLPPTQKQLNKLCKSKDVQIFYIMVKQVGDDTDISVNSLAMQEAAEKATEFARKNAEAPDFHVPSFEEPPLYKQSEPHTPEQQVVIDKLIADNNEVLRDSLPPELPWDPSHEELLASH